MDSGIFCGEFLHLLGVEVNQEQQFMVDTKGAGGQGQLQVAVVSLFFFFGLFNFIHHKLVKYTT